MSLRSIRFRLILLLFSAVSLRAQTTVSNSADDRPTLKVQVRAVLVDVVVTDKNGQPVPGLTKESFSVLEDGESQPITFFEEHVVNGRALVKLPPIPQGTFTNFPTTTNDTVNVLLVDSLNTQAIDQSYVRAQLVRFLQTTRPAARLTIFALDTRLRLLKPLTVDTSQLLAALTDPKSGSNPEVLRQLATPMQRATDDEMVESQVSPAGRAAIKEFLAEEHARQAGDRVVMTLQAFQILARYLSPIPGRKNLMWLSGSFPINFFPSTDTRHSVPRKYQTGVQQTIDMLTADQVAVYPILATGLTTSTTYESTNDGKAIEADEADSGFNLIAMETLARDTGGRAFYGNDLAKALDEAVTDGSNYYTLTYSPARTKMDGKYRRIQVKLLTGDYNLAYRRGYFADDTKTKQNETADPLFPFMAFAMPDFSQIIYKVHVLPASLQPGPGAPIAGAAQLRRPFVRYTADFAISPQDIKLETTAEGIRHGSIEIALIAYDHDGKPLNLISKKIPISLRPGVFAALDEHVGFQLHEEIDLPVGEVYLRTGICDLTSTSVGTLGIPLNVAATPSATK